MANRLIRTAGRLLAFLPMRRRCQLNFTKRQGMDFDLRPGILGRLNTLKNKKAHKAGIFTGSVGFCPKISIYSILCWPLVCQLMDPDTVWLVNGNGLSVHQEVLLLIIHLKGCNLIGIMVQAYKMLPIRKDCNGLRIVPTDGGCAHLAQKSGFLVNRIDHHRINPCIGAEQVLPIHSDFNV